MTARTEGFLDRDTTSPPPWRRHRGSRVSRKTRPLKRPANARQTGHTSGPVRTAGRLCARLHRRPRPHRPAQRADDARRPAERIYVDHGLTGTRRDRPRLREALAACRAGHTLVWLRYSRGFARLIVDPESLPGQARIRRATPPWRSCARGAWRSTRRSRRSSFVTIGSMIETAGAPHATSSAAKDGDIACAGRPPRCSGPSTISARSSARRFSREAALAIERHLAAERVGVTVAASSNRAGRYARDRQLITGSPAKFHHGERDPRQQLENGSGNAGTTVLSPTQSRTSLSTDPGPLAHNSRLRSPPSRAAGSQCLCRRG